MPRLFSTLPLFGTIAILAGGLSLMLSAGPVIAGPADASPQIHSVAPMAANGR